jgi:hypothetical protein
VFFLFLVCVCVFFVVFLLGVVCVLGFNSLCFFVQTAEDK